MASVNGSGPVCAILYARVSSDDQVRGYSLNQQIEALRAYCVREGYEVLEEVRDEGWSGAYPERPGLDRVRDAAGRYMLESFFGPGAREDWQNTVLRATGEPLNPDYFVKSLW